MKKLFLGILLSLFFTSCSQVASVDVSEQTNCGNNCGSLAIIVKGSKSFNPNIEHGNIQTYQVTISGTGIDAPIIAEFAGTATEGQIDGVPKGPGKTITVSAINPNQIPIRQGETEEVEIEGGGITNVEISLDAVPIFTNLANGNTIPNTRLLFKIFAEPGGRIIVEDITDNSSNMLADASSSLNEISLDVSTGLGQMTPALQTSGHRTYQVTDTKTNRSSDVTIQITDGTKLKAAPFYAATKSGETAQKGRVSCGTH